jgi:S1-C subfamily serine protease
VNTAIVQGANTVGFAIPAGHVTRVVEELRKNGKVVHGFMGVGMAELEAAAAQQLGVAGGVWIRSVQAGGPAEQAGLRPGDLVLKVGGREVDSSQDVFRAIATQSPGTKVDVAIRRGDKEQVIGVRLGSRPEEG